LGVLDVELLGENCNKLNLLIGESHLRNETIVHFCGALSTLPLNG
jgi:hypothetical protein